jgi:hypothetical protein
MWDDTLEHWNKNSPLHIKKQPIAMIYWPAVFTYAKSKVWSNIKQDYTDWKVCWDYPCIRPPADWALICRDLWSAFAKALLMTLSKKPKSICGRSQSVKGQL